MSTKILSKFIFHPGCTGGLPENGFRPVFLKLRSPLHWSPGAQGHSVPTVVGGQRVEPNPAIHPQHSHNSPWEQLEVFMGDTGPKSPGQATSMLCSGFTSLCHSLHPGH